jgi:hypothetical protein
MNIISKKIKESYKKYWRALDSKSGWREGEGDLAR